MGEARKPSDGVVDLGEVALALTFRSVGYAVLGVIATAVIVMLSHIAGYKSGTNTQFWLFSVAICAILQIEVYLRLRRVARTSPPVQSSARTIHGIELAAAGFLLLFSILRPYLLESDASSYPYYYLEMTGPNSVVVCDALDRLWVFHANTRLMATSSKRSANAARPAPIIWQIATSIDFPGDRRSPDSDRSK